MELVKEGASFDGKLNPNKKEVLKLEESCWFRIPSIKSLDVILDFSLSTEARITNVARNAFLQLCHHRQLDPYT